MATCHPNIPADLQGDRPIGAMPLRLPEGALHTLDPADARAVHCIAGTLWITQEGNPLDVLLTGGERFAAAAEGKIVVQALSDALARVM